MASARWLTIVAALAVLGTLAPTRTARGEAMEVIVSRQETLPASATGAVPYVKIAGSFRDAVDPADPRNAVIADLDLAPRVDGKVGYEAAFYLLRPADPGAWNGKVFYDFGNRGNKRILQWFNDGVETNDPTTAEDFGQGFLMRQGYAIAWSGWAGDVEPDDDLLWIKLPVARNPDGSAISGQVVAEYIPTRDTATTMKLPYAAARADGSNGVLTVRERSGDARQPVEGWSYERADAIHLPAPARPGFIYELVYEATDPPVMGLGHAATRDFVSLLKYGGPGAAALLPAAPSQVYAWGRSQGGRVQRDFLYWGFNEDLQGRRVFDGLLPYATGVGRLWLNARFAQPTVSNQQHSRRWAPEHEFPQRYDVATDPVTGRTDGLLARCQASGTCPAIFNVESANEYWQKGASLNHTDAAGDDLDVEALAPNMRLYAVASIQHNTTFDAVPTVARQCQQLTNPLYNGPLFRALAVALDRWVADGVAPPASRLPRRADGTLVPPEAVEFPTIPATRYGELPAMPPVQFSAASAKPIALLDFAAAPPRVVDPAAYPIAVPQVDADGNDIAGIRLPDLQAPIGTYTGWAILQDGMGAPDLCGQLGQFVPFAATRAERLASGDPRLSLEERYGSQAAYVAAVEAAARALAAERLLLAEDVDRIVAAAASRDLFGRTATATAVRDPGR